MNNIQNISNIKKSWAFLAISVLIAILFFINISAFGNSVTNAGNTNARIANLRELGVIWKDGIKFEKWENVVLHIEYPFSDVDAIWLRNNLWPAFKNIQRTFKNDGLIESIYIHLQDGSVVKMDLTGF